MKSIKSLVNSKMFESSNNGLNINGVNLNPCLYDGQPAIIIGDPVRYTETSLINKYEKVAFSSLHKYVKPLSDQLEYNDEMPSANDYFGLIFTNEDGRYPTIEWVNMNEVEYTF